MATKKAGGSTKNGRDSNPKMLGVKVYGGQTVTAGRSVRVVRLWLKNPKFLR